MRCPRCHALTRVDLQSLMDCEGVKYRRGCMSCSWDAWEVQPGKPADLSWAPLALALEATLADPDPGDGLGDRHRRYPLRHRRGDGLARGQTFKHWRIDG
jgi:hypothetical protein